MPSVIKSVSVDASDALALAKFWAAVFGSDVDEDSTPEKAFVEAAGWGGPNIWFGGVEGRRGRGQGTAMAGVPGKRLVTSAGAGRRTLDA
jgi:hypothetical protein